jgi:hypothetical protein
VSSLERLGQPRGDITADQAIATLAASTIANRPGFVDSAGRIIEANVALAVYTSQALQLPLIRALDWVYIVHGSANLTAEAQRVLARRAGFDLEVVEATAERATVKIRHHGPWRSVTFTAAQAAAAGLIDKDNWKRYCIDMLVARACTRAIGFYAAEVKAGMDAAGIETADDILEDLPLDQPVGEPAIDPADLDSIVRTVGALPDGERAWFVRQWRHVLGCPSLQAGIGLTAAHGRLARYMLDDAVDRIPAQLHDDLATPEAVDHDAMRYDPADDEGRPFGND